MEKKGKSTKFKIILAVAGSIALLLLLSTQVSIPGFPKIELTSVEGFFSSLFTFLSSKSGESFSFKLSTDMEPLVGQKLRLQGSLIDINGTAYLLKIGEQLYQLSGTTEISIESFSGEVSFEIGFLKLSGDAKSIVLDRRLTLSPAKDAIRLQLEITPYNYYITPITKDKLSLHGIYGTLERTGLPVGEEQLINASLDITGFVGTAEFAEGFLLSGSASKIQSQKFTWSG